LGNASERERERGRRKDRERERKGGGINTITFHRRRSRLTALDILSRDGIYNCSGNLDMRLRHVANQAYLLDSEVGEPAGEDRRYLY